MLGPSMVTAQLAASREGLSCMKLVTGKICCAKKHRLWYYFINVLLARTTLMSKLHPSFLLMSVYEQLLR
jgi:hypothetical protein